MQIKKAKLFIDDEQQKVYEQIEVEARELANKVEMEEFEKKFSETFYTSKHRKETSPCELKNENYMLVTTKKGQQVKLYSIEDDEFLFGDTIVLDELKKKKSMLSTAKPSQSPLFVSKKPTIKPITNYHKDLYVNKNIFKQRLRLPTHLTGIEK